MFALSDKPNPLTYLIYFMKENLFETASYLVNEKVNNSAIFNNNIDSMKVLNNTVGTVIYFENIVETHDFRFSDYSNFLDFSGNFDAISKFTPQKRYKRKVRIKSVNRLNSKVIL